MTYAWTLTAGVTAEVLRDLLVTAEGRPEGVLPEVGTSPFLNPAWSRVTIAHASHEPPAWLERLAQEIRQMDAGAYIS